MENKNYTIKDIARMAGVSAGTVDRVLHTGATYPVQAEIRFKKSSMKLIIIPTCLP